MTAWVPRFGHAIHGNISQVALGAAGHDRGTGSGVQIEALIFDMDGLLVDSEHLAYQAMDAFLAKHSVDRRQDIHDQMLGRRIPEAMAIVKRGYDLAIPVEDLIADYTIMRRDVLIGKFSEKGWGAPSWTAHRAGVVRTARSGHALVDGSRPARDV